MDSTLKALHRNVAEWLAGPSGAVLIHVALILALLLLVDYSKKPIPPTVSFTYQPTETVTFDKEPPPLVTDKNNDDIEQGVLAGLDPGAIDEPAEPVVDDDFSQTAALNPAPALQIDSAFSPLVMPGLVANGLGQRIGAENRRKAGETAGGEWARYADESVNRALKWLRENQNADGSWSTHDREAMTGLALLTFLAHGETLDSKEYGAAVTRAIQYLTARQNEAGEFAKIDTTAGTYAQAICVYAISEAYGMTRVMSLRPVMEKGAEVLIRGQQAAGGFDYRFAKSGRRDTSLGGWCSQALKAAYIAGADNSDLKTAMELAVADMKSVQKADGSFFYSNLDSHATPGITAVAVLSMQLLGHGQEPAVQNGLDYLRAAACDWKNPPEWPMYAWYYISQTKFHQGGSSWRSWNNQFAPEFIRHQNPDGSWDSAGLALDEGSAGRENMHRVYATTMAALTLQVYYRFLPTYKPIDEQAVEQPDKTEVKVEVL